MGSASFHGILDGKQNETLRSFSMFTQLVVGFFMKKTLLFLWAFLFPVFFFAEEGSFGEVGQAKKFKVGLLVMATGKYAPLGVKMIETARQYFLPNHECTFFIFTDGAVPEAKDVVRVEQKRLGWPYDTLKRFHVYDAHKDLFKEMDYLYAIDADMVFVAEVGDEILGDLVATRHWGFLNKPGTYCGNKKSTAYVPREQRKHYCCGAFYGGKRQEVLKLLEANIRNVDKDLKNNIIPKWHDEGHLNRYFIDHEPTVFLSPAYCFPMEWDLSFEPKLITLVNKSAELRR
jgi:histo-blood group ABO system transferase